MAHLIVFDPPSEGMLHREDRTSTYVNETSLGTGTLYITESAVYWLNDSGRGFSLKYPDISLHAVSRDLTSFSHPCLYVMVDSKLNGIGGVGRTDGSGDNNAAEDASDEDDDNDDEGQITEIRFVPANADSLDVMYQAMSDGNILHPDADDSFSDDDEEFDPTGTAESFLRGTAAAEEETNGNGHLPTTDDTTDAMDQVDEDQFANPEDDDELPASH